VYINCIRLKNGIALIGKNISLPLLDMQQAYYFGRKSISSLSSEAYIYFEIDFETINSSNLCRAFNQLVGRHEILRSVLTADGEILIQDMSQCVPFNFSVEDLGNIKDSEKVNKLFFKSSKKPMAIV